MLRKKVDRFIAISKEIDRELGDIAIPLGKRALIPNGVDIHRFAPIEDKLKAAHMKAQAQAEAQLKSQLHAQRLKEQQAKVNQKLKELRKDGSKKKLRKSRDKKISGVAAGIAEYLNVDPTLIRIAFVACLPFFWFFTPLTYVILGMILPDAERQLGEFKDDSDKARKNRNRRSSGDDERRIKISRD